MKTDKEKLLAFANSLEWQPIETAPKDGTEVLLYQPEEDNGFFRSAIGYESWPQKTCTGFYDNPFWYEFQAGEGYEYQEGIVNPTHWMPLPTGQAAAVIRELVAGLSVIQCGSNASDKTARATDKIVATDAINKAVEKIGETKC